MPNTILLYRESAIGVVQLNRPQVLNALNEELLTELGIALRELDDDPTCRCIIITGNEKAFAAGADIKEGVVGGTPGPVVRPDPTPQGGGVSRVETPIHSAGA